MRRRRSKLIKAVPPTLAVRWHAWKSGQKALWRGALIFTGLIILFSLPALTAPGEACLEVYTALSARLVCATLHACGEPVRLEGGVTLVSIIHPERAVVVAVACSAVDSVALFVAAVCAFPSTWRHRWIGLAVGVTVLVAANLARIAVLYLVQAHAADWFDFFHDEVGSVVFLGSTAALIFGWVVWVVSQEQHHVAV